MEKDVFRCECGIPVSLSDSQICGLCPKCGRTITREKRNKIGRENLPPYVGLAKIMMK